MFDDLRKSAEIKEEEQPAPPTAAAPRPMRRKQPRGYFLGMTPPQRFVVALLLFILVVLFGALCLLATGKIILPF
jgi:hypothetical protein